jgi:hypothetical protein
MRTRVGIALLWLMPGRTDSWGTSCCLTYRYKWFDACICESRIYDLGAASGAEMALYMKLERFMLEPEAIERC